MSAAASSSRVAQIKGLHPCDSILDLHDSLLKFQVSWWSTWVICSQLPASTTNTPKTKIFPPWKSCLEDVNFPLKRVLFLRGLHNSFIFRGSYVAASTWHTFGTDRSDGFQVQELDEARNNYLDAIDLLMDLEDFWFSSSPNMSGAKLPVDEEKMRKKCGVQPALLKDMHGHIMAPPADLEEGFHLTITPSVT